MLGGITALLLRTDSEPWSANKKLSRLQYWVAGKDRFCSLERRYQARGDLDRGLIRQFIGFMVLAAVVFGLPATVQYKNAAEYWV
jgi:hypothetical protein